MHRLGRALVRADKHRPIDPVERLHARGVEYLRHAGEFPRAVARPGRAGQVMKRQHRMGLAAAEVGLQPDHRIAALAGETRDRRRQYAPETLGRVGDAEEGGRVDVFFATLAPVHEREVRGELGIGKPRFEHVRVGLAHLAPGAQLRPCRRLVEIQFGRFAGSDRPVGRPLLIVKRIEALSLRVGAHGNQKLAHGIEVAQSLARFHRAGEMRRAVARVEAQRNETARPSEFRVVAKQVVPVVEQRLQERVDIQFIAGIGPARAARVMAPVVSMSVEHVLGDIGAEPLPERLQALLDPLLGCER